MLTPGRLYVDTSLRLTTVFRDQNGNLVDPDAVTFETFSPCGTRTAYVYDTDDEVTKTATGKYAADVVPDEVGRWVYRWKTTGTGTTFAIEGDFLIQDSPFAEICNDYGWM